jgi:hypothetical protein
LTWYSNPNSDTWSTNWHSSNIKLARILYSNQWRICQKNWFSQARIHLKHRMSFSNCPVARMLEKSPGWKDSKLEEMSSMEINLQRFKKIHKLEKTDLKTLWSNGEVYKIEVFSYTEIPWKFVAILKVVLRPKMLWFLSTWRKEKFRSKCSCIETLKKCLSLHLLELTNSSKETPST